MIDIRYFKIVIQVVFVHISVFVCVYPVIIEQAQGLCTPVAATTVHSVAVHFYLSVVSNMLKQTLQDIV